MTIVRAVLFDLDGTLVDSAPDLHGAINTVLARHGRPQLSLTEVIGMVGDGVRKLTERAFAAQGARLDNEALDAMTGEMIAVYSSRLTELTTLLPGAPGAVGRLAARGVRLGVVTNKPRDAAVAILAHFGLLAPIAVVLGGDSGLPRKPAPDMLVAALDTLGVAADAAVMVGDGAADINSARAAGMRAIAVRGGYAHTPVDQLGADLVIDSLAALPQALGFAG